MKNELKNLTDNQLKEKFEENRNRNFWLNMHDRFTDDDYQKQRQLSCEFGYLVDEFRARGLEVPKK